MNLTRITLITACMTASAIVHGSPSAIEESQGVIVTQKHSIVDASSKENREGKKFFITGQLAGAAVSPVPSVGINVGYFLNAGNLLQLEASKGTFHYRSETTTTSTYRSSLSNFDFDMPATTLGVNLKHFFGNSFYTKTGLAYRKISLTNIKIDGSQIGAVEAGSAESLAADIAIGNQWQWENFTMGCDWFGIMAPVMTLSSHYSDEGYTDSQKQSMSDSWDRIAKVTSAQLLRFYLGVAF